MTEISTSTVLSINDLSSLELYRVKAEVVTYRGKQALRLVEDADDQREVSAIAILSTSNFKDGVLETEIAGDVLPDVPAEMRGFVGIAFRVQPQGKAYECFYLRPTNGRANDQLRRNHATQYVSYPDYPWYRLREENPGVYESYTDLVPGEWTKVKIVVSGIQAQLYVNGAEQPCLIVNDLKLGESVGQIALWIGFGTVAHFSDISITTR
jgi:hypothetical protein